MRRLRINPEWVAPQGRGRDGVRPSQTLIKTGTGIWAVTYNALNRPTCFTRSNADNTVTTVTAAYDLLRRLKFFKF